MANIVVIGASGDVGRGVAAVLLERGHALCAIARNGDRLDALARELGMPAQLHILQGGFDSDADAAAALQAVRGIFSRIDGVVVSINSRRVPAPLLSRSSDELAAIIRADLIPHFTAARTLVPALAGGAVYVGIGGGSADFVLEGGVPQSVAQAGLRMLYRALVLEFAHLPVTLRELIIASVVNGASTGAGADPLWVTAREVGLQVAAILETPDAFPSPVLRIARRDASGRPAFSAEAPTRRQGFT